MSVDARTPTLREEWRGAYLASPCTAGISGGIGYLGALCFTTLLPGVGGAYLAAQNVIHTFVNPIFDKYLYSPKYPTLSSALSFTATFFTSAAITKLLFDAAGVALTVGNIATILTASVGVLLLVGAVTAVSVAAFALLAQCLCKESYEALQERIAES